MGDYRYLKRSVIVSLTAADPDQLSTIIWMSPASLWAHSNLLIGHFIMNDTTDTKRTQSANSMKILYVSLFWSRFCDAYHTTTATILFEYFVARAKDRPGWENPRTHT